MVCGVVLRHIISIVFNFGVIVPIFRRSIIIGSVSFADVAVIALANTALAGIISSGSFVWVKVLFVTAVTHHFSNYERDLIFVILRKAIFPVVLVNVNTVTIESSVGI